MEHHRVLSVLDRIAHSSTKDDDLEISVGAMRRLLGDKLPSEVLGKTAPRTRTSEADKREIKKLRTQIDIIKTEQATTEREKQHLIEDLIEQIAKLQAATVTQKPIQSNGGYTRLQVTQIIQERFIKDHGVKKAVVQRNAALRESGRNVPKITDNLWQKWRIEDHYPAWAIDQLLELTPDDILTNYKWSQTDKDYLASLWQDDPKQTNEQLAVACSRHFAHKITDSGIRGMLHRLGLLRPKLKPISGD
jgi:hypothetical protein